MKEAFINGLIAGLSGKVGKEFIIFLISMVPILELRGGLLAAGPALLDVPMWQAIPICFIGNLVPIPFILLLITKIFDWMKGTKKLKPLVEKLEHKAMNQSANIEKYEFWGLVAFVGIPLPGTGAWTGTIAASFLKMDFKSSAIAAMCGVLLAGVIMMTLSAGFFTLIR